MTSKIKKEFKHKVLIIGSGVIGLTTAYLLLERGHHVVIIAKDFPSIRRLPKIASEASGAFCVPPEAMAQRVAEIPHSDSKSEQRILNETLKEWSAYGGERYTSLCKDSRNTGVYLRELILLSREKIDPIILKQYKQMKRFRNSMSLIKEKGLRDESGQIKDAFSFLAPIIDPPKFGIWLLEECKRKGAHLIQGAIRGLLTEQADALKMTYGVQFIVNCSGLGSIELAGDQGMFPARGILLKVKNDGSLFPKIEFCVEGQHTSFGYDESGQEIVGRPYLIARGEDSLMCGSFYQPNRWDHSASISAPYVQSMIRQCKDLCPCLNSLRDSDFQVTVGIRPARKPGLRLEQDPIEPCIFHNYGHYRWGMTLNWGSARDIVYLIENEANKTQNAKSKGKSAIAKL